MTSTAPRFDNVTVCGPFTLPGVCAPKLRLVVERLTCAQACNPVTHIAERRIEWKSFLRNTAQGPTCFLVKLRTSYRRCHEYLSGVCKTIVKVYSVVATSRYGVMRQHMQTRNTLAGGSVEKWFAPPGSNRSGGGENEAVGASGVEGRIRRLGKRAGRNVNAEQASKRLTH